MRSLTWIALFVSAMLGPTPDPAPQGSLGVVGQRLGHFSPDTLRPVGPVVGIPEPHAAGALSPSGRLLAYGLSKNPEPDVRRSGRVGLAIAEVTPLRVVHEVQTGIAAEQVAFAGSLVAALLQDGQVVVVDPASGDIVRRARQAVPSACIFPGRPALAADGSVAFAAPDARGVARLAVVSPGGTVRSRRIAGLRARGTRSSCGAIGLAAVGERLVLAAGGRIASVSLSNLEAEVRDVPLRARCCTERWSVAAVPGGGVSVAAETRSGPLGRNRTASGLVVLDRSLRRVRWRDAHAHAVAVGGRTVLAVGDGVRGYDSGGRRRFSVLRGAPVFHADVFAGRAYVSTPRRLFVVDARTGRTRARHPTALTGLWFA